MSPDFKGKESILQRPEEILLKDSKQQKLLKEVKQVETELNIAQLRVEVIYIYIYIYDLS
jgi:hypothetical protein